MGDQVTRMNEALSAVHAELLALAGQHENGEALHALAGAEARLSAGTFRLVILGEYKRGKSTLINALLGRQVLPMGVVPLTSVITEVAFAPEPQVEVEFTDGRREGVPVEHLSQYVTETGNPRNVKAVKRTCLLLPSALLQAGVTVVDTPGVGSVLEHNTEVTYDFLAESDAVVIVLAADQPLSAEERRLLSALAGITDHVLFAVNRTDVLEPDDVATSVGFVRRMLAENGVPPEHVFPISAKQALDAAARDGAPPAAFGDFERALRALLIGRKSGILERRARILIQRAAGLLTLEMAAELHALGKGRQALEDLIGRLELAAREAAEAVERSAVLLRHDVRKVHEISLRRELDATHERLAVALWPRVEAAMDRERGHPLVETVERQTAALGEWVVTELRRWYPATQALVEEGLTRALDAHTRRVGDAAGDVLALANARLGMRAHVPRAAAPMDERPRFYFKDWDYAGDPLRTPRWMFRLPRRWAAPRARRALRELMERRIHQNLEAIRHDWVTRLDEAGRQFTRSSHQQVHGIIGMLAEGLKRAERMRVDETVAERRSELERDLSAVRRLEARLDEMDPARIAAAGTERG